MFLARSILARLSWNRFVKPRAKRRTLGLEVLEDRTLLSTWIAKGPAPILDAGGDDAVAGRIDGIAADPLDSNTIYIAAAAGGVWKTTDGGTTWRPLTDDQETLFMGAIALAPSDPNTIYAGTGEADNSGDSYYGRGILKSTDAGASWILLGTTPFDRRTIAKIVVSPTDPNTVYAAVSAEAINGVTHSDPGTGIWKSTDGGFTWTNTTAGISTTQDYSDLAMDPLDPQTLYAAVGTYSGSSVNGIYKTSDGGNTWIPAGNSTRGRGSGNTRIAIAPTNDRILYVSIANPRTGGLGEMLKSVDGGATWTQLANTPNYMGAQGWFDSTLAVDPSDPNTVYAAGGPHPDSIIRSRDGGLSWSDISFGADHHGPHVDHHAIAFDSAGRLLDGDDGGIWRLDGQNPVHWNDLNGNLQITEFIGIALDPTNPHIIYGGSQDNGTDVTTGSLAWQEFAIGGDGGYVRIDFNNPQTIYHTFAYSPGVPGEPYFLQRSDNGGTSWANKTNGINLSDPANFYPPLIMDPANSSRLLLGTNRIFETTNRGDNWTAISGPDANGWVGSDPIDCLAVAPSDGNTIYASAGGRIFVSSDDGASWHEHDIPGVTDSIADLVVDPENSQVVYAVRDRFDGGHVFATGDGGMTWSDLSSNLPNLPAYTFALGAGSLYVGNDDGVYTSTDSGATWSRLGDALPHAQVHDLVLSPNFGILAAGTYGRGLWELSLATHFSVTAPANAVTAGGLFQLTVTALDDQNNPITGYTGTVRFTSTDPGATLPADYTFTLADGGAHTFDVTLFQAGSQSIAVADLAAGLDGSDTLTVTPAAADHFSLGIPAGGTAGAAFDVTVTALDPFNNVDVNYQGTVHFTTTDPGAGVVLPADVAFTTANAGVVTLAASVTLVTAGSQTLTATDTVSGIAGTAGVLVAAAAADHLLVVAPARVVSGVAFDVTVTVQDAFNNTVATNLGTVQFTTSDSDPGVVLPLDYAFSSGDAGTHTFASGVTLITVGQQMLSVEDPSLGIVGAVLIDVIAPAAPPGGGSARGPGSGLFLQEIASRSPRLVQRSSVISPPVPRPSRDLQPSRLEVANSAAFFLESQRIDRRVFLTNDE